MKKFLGLGQLYRYIFSFRFLCFLSLYLAVAFQLYSEKHNIHDKNNDDHMFLKDKDNNFIIISLINKDDNKDDNLIIPSINKLIISSKNRIIDRNF
ncbi:hypothetical protein RhiirA5_361055 [Rhizophagus irregularis]|uniref:Uncharacterized protein n=1 Tax=Rhizophagus irregularis TaxID=588596 RepID=A0A2N0PFT2_9GLOM|nr:hypothetical protein RhiirA5_361055 [Rhizophagus irregularis]